MKPDAAMNRSLITLITNCSLVSACSNSGNGAGGNNSSARLTAIDNVNVRIDIDTNGDGAIDDTINTTWVELDGGQAGIM